MKSKINAKLKDHLDESSDDFTNFNIKPCNRFYVYLLDELCCLVCCSKKGDKRTQFLKKKIDIGKEKLYDDFNLRTLIRYINQSKKDHDANRKQNKCEPKDTPLLKDLKKDFWAL